MPLLFVFGFEATYYHESGTFLKFSFKDRGTYSIFLDISKCTRNVLTDTPGRVIFRQKSLKSSDFCNFPQLECHPVDYSNLSTK